MTRTNASKSIFSLLLVFILSLAGGAEENTSMRGLWKSESGVVMNIDGNQTNLFMRATTTNGRERTGNFIVNSTGNSASGDIEGKAAVITLKGVNFLEVNTAGRKIEFSR